MKALYCDRCGQYYHEKMPGYINQANISILDAETSGPEKTMDLCEECKKIVYECINYHDTAAKKSKRKPGPHLILTDYKNGMTLDKIAEKYEMTKEEVKNEVDKFR